MEIKKILVIGLSLLLVIISISGCIKEEEDEQKPTKPIINSFSVYPYNITEGEIVTFDWDVEYATRITIEPGNMEYDIDDEAMFILPIGIPTENTTYTLTAYNSTLTTTATCSVIVRKKETEIEIEFEQNESNGTLTVINVSLTDISWSKIQVTGGTKPTKEFVEVGDIITRYIGIVKITYDNTTNLGEYVFFHGAMSIPLIAFSQDIDQKTLTVTELEFSYGSVYWGEIQVMGGTKPTGKVNVGDVITNCFGTVRVIYKNTTYLGEGVWEF